jgi:hypothetical protein
MRGTAPVMEKRNSLPGKPCLQRCLFAERQDAYDTVNREPDKETDYGIYDELHNIKKNHSTSPFPFAVVYPLPSHFLIINEKTPFFHARQRV